MLSGCFISTSIKNPTSESSEVFNIPSKLLFLSNLFSSESRDSLIAQPYKLVVSIYNYFFFSFDSTYLSPNTDGVPPRTLLSDNEINSLS